MITAKIYETLDYIANIRLVGKFVAASFRALDNDIFTGVTMTCLNDEGI